MGTAEKQITLLEGYIKVTDIGAKQLQQHNGKDAIFGRPLAQGTAEYCKQPIQWITKEPDDNYMVYFTKCKNEAFSSKLPLAFRMGGGSCLGLRHTGTTRPPNISVAWRVQGAPSWFRSIELQEALSGAGWTEIQVLYPPRGKQPWLIKAKPPPNSEGEILGVATGDFTLYLSRVPPRAPHVVGIKPVHITRKAQPAHEVNLNTDAEDMETELEDPPSADANMTGEAAKDPAKKRDPPEKQSPLKKKHKESAPNFLQGYELKDCGGDGACGYNSLAFAYWLSNNADKPHPSNEEIKTMGRTLRQQIINTFANTRGNILPLSRRTQGGPKRRKAERFPLPLTLGSLLFYARNVGYVKLPFRLRPTGWEST